MTGPDLNTDAIIACADLAGRTGAKDFELGYVRDDVPVEDAGWYAHAQFQGARITVDERRSPSEAAMALAERLLTGATCRCGKPVALSDGRHGCRWRLVGQRWEPGCDAPAIHVKGPRGDMSAMHRAMALVRGEAQPANRDERRALRKSRRRR